MGRADAQLPAGRRAADLQRRRCAGPVFGQHNGQAIWLGIAAIMVLPILMIGASVAVEGPALRWLTVIAAVGLFIFNIIGLPSYPGLYDKFLNVVGLGFNAATAWYAWASSA